MNIDIVFISYDEENADENWRSLQKIYPHAKRVDKVKGIREAHKKASDLSSTDFFFTIDGDNLFLEDIILEIPTDLKNNTVYVWRCQNSVNGLIYGYGGLKLWPKAVFNTSLEDYGDHAMSATEHYQVIHQLVTKTCFNTSEFSSWKSGFREACKLTKNVMSNDEQYSRKRLEIWMSVGAHADFGVDCIKGARQGCLFTMENDIGDVYNLINDFDLLQDYYIKFSLLDEQLLLTKLKRNGFNVTTHPHLISQGLSEEQLRIFNKK